MLQVAKTIYRIMSATIRDNIVFSYEYDETFYNMVLDGMNKHFCSTDHPLIFGYAACALRPDLALMPEGDMTEVGEKGQYI